MTHGQILKAVIEKARKEGKTFLFWNWEAAGIPFGQVMNQSYEMLFSHDFAKAFFGEKDVWYETECTCGGVDFHIGGHDAHHAGGVGMDGKEKPPCAKVTASRGYKFHLKEMVVEEDPIKYLEQHLC